MQWLRQRREAGRTAGSKAPIFLPDFRPENLIVRRDLLNKLRSALVDESGLFLLSGEPGAGKSTLALMFTYESQKDFDAVVHQVCGDRSVETIVAELVDQLRGPLRPNDLTGYFVRIAAVLCITVGITLITRYTIELPIMSLRKYVLYRPTKPATAEHL